MGKCTDTIFFGAMDFSGMKSWGIVFVIDAGVKYTSGDVLITSWLTYQSTLD